MRFKKHLSALVFILIASALVAAQDKTTGAIKGKVRTETGSADGITIIIRQGEKEVTRGSTNKNGEFLIARLQPGIYGVTMRKTGLSIGTMEDIEVKAGKTRTLGDSLILTIDEGSIAFISGSVFNADGRSVPNAKVELAKIFEDGRVKRIDGRITTETGSFKFRLSPEVAKYRVTLKLEGDDISKDVEVDGAAIYRVALSLPQLQKPKP